MKTQLAAAVKEASGRHEVRQAVRELYLSLAEEIARRKPLCLVSGKCCRFDEYGHRLYVTTMELASFVHECGPIPAGDGSGCAFQVNKLCTVHTIRPMGCRLFFCDATSTEWQHQQYELFHARLKKLHETMDVPYVYMEWREALRILGES